jgi:hypothetical protein
MQQLTAKPPVPGVGEDISGPEIEVTAHRLQVYGDGLLTSAAGMPAKVGANIHTDVEYAREQGLAAPVVDGMLSVNYLSSMLVRAFGQAYLEHGQLRAKFIKPVYVDQVVRPRGVVRESAAGEDGRTRYALDVWVETAEGVKVVDGDASVEVP